MDYTESLTEKEWLRAIGVRDFSSYYISYFSVLHFVVQFIGAYRFLGAALKDIKDLFALPVPLACRP